jgi:molecular chaperone HscA
MSLLTIQEPKQESMRLIPVVGIDLGTTHSLIAVYSGNQVEILPDAEGHYLLPSVVQYLSEKDIIVGIQAKSAYESDPENTLVSVKRDLTSGKYWDTRAGRINAIDASAEILKALLNRVKQAYPDEIHTQTTLNLGKAASERSPRSALLVHDWGEGAQPTQHKFKVGRVCAVITVPAYFDEPARQATKLAARQAGIEVWRLLNEPTAAAIAYGLNKKAAGTCLVFDLGGGTFDVSILQLRKGIFEVLATGGDPVLGGDDIDDLVIEQTGLPRMQARALKEALSDQLTTENQFSRQNLETSMQPLVERMLIICEQVLKDAKLTRKDLDEVILVGGSTKIPFIQQQVETFFDKKPLCSLDPEKVVAMGAAIQASILSGQYQGEEILLLDVTPLSLGVEMMGGIVEKMILRNTPIPAVFTETFTTYADQQTGLSLHVVQGERERVNDCRSLAKFDLTGIPPMPAGEARIDVTFRIDADGLLTVEAIEKVSGVRSHIVVNTTYGLTQAEIEATVEEALLHRSEDHHIRQEAAEKQLKEALERALA